MCWSGLASGFNGDFKVRPASGRTRAPNILVRMEHSPWLREVTSCSAWICRGRIAAHVLALELKVWLPEGGVPPRPPRAQDRQEETPAWSPCRSSLFLTLL